MAGVIIALGVTNTLLTALNSPVLKGAFLSCVYADRLEKLKGTVTTVKSVLLDAAKKDELTEIDRDYIVKLKDAVYDADDLFDELVTQADRKNNDIFEKVRQLFLSFKKSRKVKKLESRLKDIAEDRSIFGFISINTIPQERQRVEETFSYVSAPTVVGRDDDARKVIGILLDSANPVNFLTIVGVGGVGKTTLAQLVFDEKWIKSKFDLRLWVCVSDQDGASLNVKSILVKILELLGCKSDSSSSTEFLHGEIRRKVQGNRVLLVLDDVWNESAVELNNLKKLLMIGGSGSRIIATTRSMKMARIVGDAIHELQGLSTDSSQHLFEMTVFGNESKPTKFFEISEKIVEKCSNIPLVIKVVGSLLRGQPIGKWQTFLMSKFSEFVKDENDIMSILKLSYDHLDPSLKSCFAYCAIFPKDYVISKEMLMDLWKAHGFIVPFEECQSIDNAGEEHFSELLQRCFFQDVTENEWGGIESFKIHDLMHDLAQRVSGNEICVINSSMSNPEYKVRHIFFGNSVSKLIDPINHSIVFNTTNKSKIRSYLMFKSSSNDDVLYELHALESTHGQDEDELVTFEIPKNWGHLRALALQIDYFTNLRIPDTIGNLLHLRYLNLSKSGMKNLPDSIVKLYNLKTLDISYCEYLNEWPKEFSKLVNLRHLYWDFCFKLKCMPVGMSKLTNLSRLTKFVVKDESASGMQRVGQLKDLRAIAMNLRGHIHIVFSENFKSADGYNWEGSCLEDAQHLTELEIHFYFPPFGLDYALSLQNKEKEEVVMEKMKPNGNLKRFILKYYSGEKIAGWGGARDNWATFLPYLVFIEVYACHLLQELPVLSKLLHLKTLFLRGLMNLEYMEEEATGGSGLEFSGLRSFFPSLESLHLYSLENLKGWWRSGDSNESHRQLAFPYLENLKGWWRSGDSNESHRQLAFPNLSDLEIVNCPRLVSFPPCLSLPKLVLIRNSQILRIRTPNGEHATSS